MRITYLISVLIFYLFAIDLTCAYEFPNAQQKIPRIGRSKQPVDPRNEAFEKFFLKASKSVPRIGRSRPLAAYYSENADTYYDTSFKRPSWVDISEKIEYEPELFGNPQLLEEYETALSDDPLVYDIPSRMRFKRGSSYQRKP